VGAGDQERRVPGVPERGAGSGGDLRVDFHGRYEVFAEPVAEQAGGVAGARADLQDAVAVLDLEVFEHPDDKAGQGAR
jgi:hypothetical protein